MRGDSCRKQARIKVGVGLMGHYTTVGPSVVLYAMLNCLFLQ